MAPHTMSFLFLYPVLALIFCTSGVYSKMQCQSQSGKPVDWFIIYKMPESERSLPQNSFFYMDVDQPKWQLSKRTIDEKQHSVFNTLSQIYDSSITKAGDQMYAMYNDDPPGSDSDDLKWRSSTYGHTKGVVSFDETTGFWLVHSTPNFPPSKNESYGWPRTAVKFAQSFLCISMETKKYLDVVGKQLQFNHPDIYDSFMPDSMMAMYPEITAAIKGEHPTEDPYFHQAELHSLAGTVFQSFAKYINFQADLYSTWLAPVFKADLLVETWMNGRNPLCSNCTGKYKVYNINQIKIETSTASADFKETEDHAKWAITNSSSNMWTCIGDINRQKSQEHRPGGTVCFQNPDVWTQFSNIVGGYDACGETSHSYCVK